MKWPWISRLAFDTLREETERLREQNADLIDTITRLKRIQAGTTETPRPERPQLKPMPERLRTYCEGFDNPSIMKAERDALWRRHAQGTPWSNIEVEVLGGRDLSEEDEDV